MQNGIIIIYKGKLLLVTKDSLAEENLWSFVGENYNWTNSQESALKILKRVTKLKSLIVEKISLSDSGDDTLYFTRLSDKNVNSIERSETEKLEFYNLKEVLGLNLTSSTQTLVSNFQEKITQLLKE